jgi:hypothetical protein
MIYECYSNDDTINRHTIAKPQTHYSPPWTKLKDIWLCFIFILIAIMLFALLLPSNPGMPFVVAYIIFCITTGTGMIFFAVPDPSIGSYRRTSLPPISDDVQSHCPQVDVYIIRPLFGWRRCEKVGGRHVDKWCKGGDKNYNGAYVSYIGAFGGVVRVRREPAIFRLGNGESEDCTDVVARGMTRLQWLRGDYSGVREGSA